MTILLDSSVLIDFLRKRPACLERIRKAVDSGHNFAVSVINVAEVLSGMRSHERSDTTAFLATLETYPVTLSIAQRAGELKSVAARKGHTLELDDMLIAATAIEYGFEIMTDNRKDFEKTAARLHPKKNQF